MVISTSKAYAAFRQSNGGPEFDRWGASQRVTFATNPLVRGTCSLGGGLVPARNHYMFRR
jgi:hypothetical protein